MVNLGRNLFLLLFLFFFSKGQEYVVERNYAILHSGVKEMTLYSRFYQLNTCMNQEEETARVIYEYTSHSIVKVENGVLYACYFEDNICTKEKECVELGTLNNVSKSERIPENDDYYFSYAVFEYAELPEVPMDEGKYVNIEMYDEDTCSGIFKQQAFVKSHTCARNWVGYGNYDSIDDMLWIACDKETIIHKIFDDPYCKNLIMINYFNLGLINLVENYFPDFKFCFKYGQVLQWFNFKCIEPKDREEFNIFKSEARYMVHDLYYENDEKKCLGTPTLKVTFTLDECSDNQYVMSNSETYAHRIYDVNDTNCEREPTSILFANLALLSTHEDDPTCTNFWMYRQAQYYRKPTYFNEYDLKDFSSYVALIPNIDCENIDYEAILKYKTNPIRTFYYAESDFCFSKYTMFTYRQRDQGFKGYCKNGKLELKHYDGNEYKSSMCEETFYKLENNSYCSTPFYFTCLSYICYQVEQYEDNVCSGHGSCINFDTCLCKSGWEGPDCSEESSSKVYLYFLVPSLVIFIISAVIILSISFFIFVFFLLKLTNQKKSLKEFLEIEDIDILMKESKIEKLQGNSMHSASSKANQIRLNTKSFEVDVNSIELIKSIGEGGSGSKIFLCNWEGKKIAYKLFRLGDNYDEFYKELEFAINLRHPNILSYFGCTITPPKIGILMENAEKGALKDFIEGKKFRKRSYPLRERIRLMLEIAFGMQFLHSKEIIHRDLKSDNVLLDKNENAKIMDFGLSRQVKGENGNSDLTKRIGTSYYMAPEITLTSIYTNKIDIFSFAMMLWEAYYESFEPYGEDAYKISCLELKVAKDPYFRPKIKKEDEKKYPEYFNMMKNCWSGADQRFGWEEIKKILKDTQELIKINDAISQKKNTFSDILTTRNKKISNLQSTLKKAEEIFKRKATDYETTITKLKSKIEENCKKEFRN